MQKLARFAAAAAEYLAAAFGAREAMLTLGLLMVGVGAREVYVPAGWLLPGAALVAIAVFGTR